MTTDDEASALLHRLSWLIERSKVGFKGNPPPFEDAKTQRSVELMKRKEKKKLPGGVNFKPFTHGPPRLAEDSRPTRHLKGLDTHKYDVQMSEAALGRRGQRLDRATGCPEIVAALCWDLKGRETHVKEVPKGSDEAACLRVSGCITATTGKRQYLATLSKEEREAYYKSEAINHPKFTRQSREYREGLGWYQGSQLDGLLRRNESSKSVPTTRNCIRLVSRET